MFPTGVGMNRGSGKKSTGYFDVPHRRGDEPLFDTFNALEVLCSPQAWG